MIESILISNQSYRFNNNQVGLLNNLYYPDFSLKEFYKEFAFFGGFRCGKSFILQFIAWMLCVKYPNLNILYVRDTYAQLMDSVIVQMKEDFEKYGEFRYIVASREARFRNGSTINFRAFDKDTNILSTQYDAAFICQAEDIKEELFLQILGRLSGKNLPHPLLFTEGNPANTWVKKRYKDKSKEALEKEKIYFVEGSTEENKHNLPHGYIDNLIENYPKSWINRYIYGGWEQIDEMVFSEFREKDNLLDPISSNIFKSYKIVQGMDYGWRNPTAILWAYIDYDGLVYVFDEWGGPEKIIEEIAEASKKWGKHPIILDYSAKAKQRDGRSVWDDLQAYDLNLLPSNKDELNNIVLVNSLFKKRQLYITRNCQELLKEVLSYKWKRLKLGADQNKEETPIQKDNHYIDALLYLVAYIEGKPSEDNYNKIKKNSIKYHTVNNKNRSNWYHVYS